MSTVHRLEQAVGATLDEGVRAAERTIVRRFGIGVLMALRTLLRIVFWTIVVAYFAFGAMLLVTRYWVLPQLDSWRGQIEGLVSEALHTPVSIGRIHGGWRAFNPHLIVLDVRISGPHGAEALALPRVEATVSWASLFTLEPRFAALTILAPELEIARLSDGRFSVAGFLVDPSTQVGFADDTQAADWLLAQSRIAIRDARVHYRDERDVGGFELDLDEVNFLFEQRFGVHRFGLQATPTSAIAAPIDIRGQFKRPPFVRPSDVSRWRGEIFAQLDYADIAFIARLIDAPVTVDHAHGALRSWLAFDQRRITRVTADLALKDVDVTLAAGLAPLQLVSLQGRVSQQIFSQDSLAMRGGDQFRAIGLTFATAKSTFSPLDLTLRHTPAYERQPDQTFVEARRIDLTSLAALAPHLPMAAEMRNALTRHAFRGTLSDVTARWEGVVPQLERVTLKAKFAGLASAAQPAVVAPGERPQPGLPGFENLLGAIDIDRGNGTLQLASKNAALTFPGVFAEPRLVFNELAALLRWSSSPQREVRVESLRAANADAELVASGMYRATSRGPGWVDLTGRLTRGEASAAYRYVPLVAGAKTIDWVRHALIAGRTSNATFRLRGDLERFPFRQGDGEFRVAGGVNGGVLDVWPAEAAGGKQAQPGSIWPLLSDIDAELVFDRASMTVSAQRAEAMGAQIGATVVHIADLEHDPTLTVRGQASGALEELLRYANASPVVRWTGGVTQVQAAAGPARLDLQMQIPLERAADAKVAGTLHLRDNDVTLKDMPPFTRVTGALQFNERGVLINGLTAQILGATTRIDATTRADGAHLFTASGSMTPAGLKRIVSIPAVHRLLDRTQGSARYQASIVVKDGTEVRVESDLVGLAIDGVAPLRKTAAEALPLRYEQSAAVNNRDEIRVNAGSMFAVRLQRQLDKGEAKIARGVIALNEAPNLPDSGVLLLASAPRLDVEAWLALLAGGDGIAGASGSSGNPAIDAVALHTPELVLYGRTFGNVTLGATRVASGYDANVKSDHVTGHVAWRPPAAGEPDALGQITARLSRLLVPESHKDDLVEALRSPPKQIPSLELSAEQFELAGMKLGRLQLSASNVGTGPSAVWRLSQLEISNPDLRLTASGAWTPADSALPNGARRMQASFTMDLANVGDSLTRFGYPATMSAGSGRLEGNLAWVGSPLDLHVPSLSGTVKLAVDNGRFLKVETGNAARLLSLLSLQSLSRALVLDGGRQFAEGFAYTSLRADATIADGLLATENLRMTGPSAVVLMSGTVNLDEETQALRVVVLPEIDASTAALALGVANPILGIGTYVAQLLLRDPLSKAFALEYDVTGPWAEPKVIRRRRVTPDNVESIK